MSAAQKLLLEVRDDIETFSAAAQEEVETYAGWLRQGLRTGGPSAEIALMLVSAELACSHNKEEQTT